MSSFWRAYEKLDEKFLLVVNYVASGRQLSLKSNGLQSLYGWTKQYSYEIPFHQANLKQIGHKLFKETVSLQRGTVA